MKIIGRVNLLLIVLVVFLASLGLAGCSDDDAAVSGSSTSQISSASQSSTSGASSSAGLEVISETTTDEPYSFEGNIAQVRALTATIVTSGNPTNFGQAVQVTGVVHALKSVGQYWIQDKHAGIFVYNPSAGHQPSIGDKVSFSVTRGEKYYEVYQITAYTDYAVLSSSNAVYRQSGSIDTAKPSAHQGQAWRAEIVLTLPWTASTQSAVVDSETGLRARNSTGAALATGVYIIRGPVHQTSGYCFPDIFPGMVERLGDVSSSSSSLSPFVPQEAIPQYDSSTRLRIGSFNIQIFGTTKLSRANALTALASIATNFDILAIQEVGSNGHPDDSTCVTVLNGYTNRINTLLGGTQYDYVRGHQYAYVYRTARVTLVSSALYNGTNSFTYPPLAARFSTVTGNFDFVLLTIHTSPGVAGIEIPRLRLAMEEMSNTYSEPDVICLGDFNADGTYFSPGLVGGDLAGWPQPSYTTVIKNGADTTVSGNAFTYDRIQLSKSLAEDYWGTSGVFRFGKYYDMRICEGAPTQAGTEAALSDHYPVWADFKFDGDTD